jgi:NTE family protein
MSSPAGTPKQRVAIVLSGGGARGAYEAGVLSYLFENVYPRLGPDFEFDIISGTSVGAIHAAYIAATSGVAGVERSERLVRTWERMSLDHVFQLSAGDIFGIPMRALGLIRQARPRQDAAQREVVGGIVDVSPLERLVIDRIPWQHLRENIARGRPGALCVSCTEVRRGLVTVFMDGGLADPEPWNYDPNACAVNTHIDQRHVRASAAIPFLFPAVRIGDRYYVDGGMRSNTPLSPALRLRATRVLVIALKHKPGGHHPDVPEAEDAITQPAFLLGKVLDILMLDHLEYELQRMELINAMLDRGEQICGPKFREDLNVEIRAERGVGYRKVEAVVVRPSVDLGSIAARAQREPGTPMPPLARLITHGAVRGTPPNEADLLSYLFFDRRYTEQLVELGREDARRREEDIIRTLTGQKLTTMPGAPI